MPLPFVSYELQYLQYIFLLAKNREVVFLDIRKANLIFGVCLFCNFVDFTIYAINGILFQVAFLARNHRF